MTEHRYGLGRPRSRGGRDPHQAGPARSPSRDGGVHRVRSRRRLRPEGRPGGPAVPAAARADRTPVWSTRPTGCSRRPAGASATDCCPTSSGHPQRRTTFGPSSTGCLELGFDVGRSTGCYGHETGTRKEFQRSVGLPSDGTCGPARSRRSPGSRRSSPVGGPTPAEPPRPSPAGPRLPGKVVVIDPGHGGPDRGCSATASSRPRSLATSPPASRAGSRPPASGVFLTRGARREPRRGHPGPVRQRDERRPVVSLHVDAHPNPAAGGVATYFYGSSLPGTASAVGSVRRPGPARDRRPHRPASTAAPTPRPGTCCGTPGCLPFGWNSATSRNAGDAAGSADPGFRDVVAEAIVVAVQRVYLPPDTDTPTGVLQLGELIARWRAASPRHVGGTGPLGAGGAFDLCRWSHRGPRRSHLLPEHAPEAGGKVRPGMQNLRQPVVARLTSGLARRSLVASTIACTSAPARRRQAALASPTDSHHDVHGGPVNARLTRGDLVPTACPTGELYELSPTSAPGEVVLGHDLARRDVGRPRVSSSRSASPARLRRPPSR